MTYDLNSFFKYFRVLYDNPVLEASRIDNFAVKFQLAIKAKLKSKCLDPRIVVECEHDVYRYIFNGKGSQSNVPGATMFEKEDFERMMLPDSWFYTLNKHGDGHCVDFPIRIKPILRKSTKDYRLNAGILVESPRYLFEMLSLYMTKRPCSKDSLH